MAGARGRARGTWASGAATVAAAERGEAGHKRRTARPAPSRAREREEGRGGATMGAFRGAGAGTRDALERLGAIGARRQ